MVTGLWKKESELESGKVGMRIGIQVKFPKEPFTAMDEYTVTVTFEPLYKCVYVELAGCSVIPEST